MADPAPGTAVLLADARGEAVRPALVLATTDDGLAVIPVSHDVAMATEWDLLLPADLFGYAALAEVWNHGTVLPEQVEDVVGVLPRELNDALRQLAHAARRGGDIAADLPVGPPVLEDDDPRLLFQDAEGESLRTFWAPAITLAGAATLGELVRHRRDELAVGQEELPEWIEELEHDRLYLPRQLPPRELAALMRRLQIGASRRLGRLARSTLETIQPSLARGGQVAPAPDAPTPDAYVEDFLHELRQAG